MIQSYFNEGRKAYKEGVSVTDNPYMDNEESEPCKSWEHGWDHEWFIAFRVKSDRAPRGINE